MAETGKILFPVTAVTELQDAQTQWDTLVIVLNSVANLPGYFGAIKAALEAVQMVRHLSSLANFFILKDTRTHTSRWTMPSAPRCLSSPSKGKG